MSRSLNKSLLSKVEKESTKNETKNPSIWFQTAAGEIVELEYELGWKSPLICEKLKCGVGSTRSSPILLDPNVKKEALELIFDYFRFHQAPGHSDNVRAMFACFLFECKLFVDEFLRKDIDTLCLLVRAAECLQMEKLLDIVCRAISRNIETSSREVKHEFASLCEKSLEREGLNLQVNQNGDLRLRLARKLSAKPKKDLQAVENKAETEIEAVKHEDHAIDDLISFINGGDRDAKGVQTPKKKKKNRKRGKEKNKTSSTEASFPKKVVENR